MSHSLLEEEEELSSLPGNDAFAFNLHDYLFNLELDSIMDVIKDADQVENDLKKETKESEVAGCATESSNGPIMPQTEGQEQSTVKVHPEAIQTAELAAKEKDGPPTSETKGHETTIVSESKSTPAEVQQQNGGPGNEAVQKQVSALVQKQNGGPGTETEESPAGFQKQNGGPITETKECKVACATESTNGPIMPQTEGQEQSTVKVHPEAIQTLGAELVAKEKDDPPTSETKGHETTIVSESKSTPAVVQLQNGGPGNETTPAVVQLQNGGPGTESTPAVVQLQNGGPGNETTPAVVQQQNGGPGNEATPTVVQQQNGGPGNESTPAEVQQQNGGPRNESTPAEVQQQNGGPGNEATPAGVRQQNGGPGTEFGNVLEKVGTNRTDDETHSLSDFKVVMSEECQGSEDFRSSIDSASSVSSSSSMMDVDEISNEGESSSDRPERSEKAVTLVTNSDESDVNEDSHSPLDGVAANPSPVIVQPPPSVNSDFGGVKVTASLPKAKEPLLQFPFHILTTSNQKKLDNFYVLNTNGKLPYGCDGKTIRNRITFWNNSDTSGSMHGPNRNKDRYGDESVTWSDGTKVAMLDPWSNRIDKGVVECSFQDNNGTIYYYIKFKNAKLKEYWNVAFASSTVILPPVGKRLIDKSLSKAITGYGHPHYNTYTNLPVGATVQKNPLIDPEHKDNYYRILGLNKSEQSYSLIQSERTGKRILPDSDATIWPVEWVANLTEERKGFIDIWRDRYGDGQDSDEEEPEHITVNEEPLQNGPNLTGDVCKSGKGDKSRNNKSTIPRPQGNATLNPDGTKVADSQQQNSEAPKKTRRHQRASTEATPIFPKESTPYADTSIGKCQSKTANLDKDMPKVKKGHPNQTPVAKSHDGAPELADDATRADNAVNGDITVEKYTAMEHQLELLQREYNTVTKQNSELKDQLRNRLVEEMHERRLPSEPDQIRDSNLNSTEVSEILLQMGNIKEVFGSANKFLNDIKSTSELQYDTFRPLMEIIIELLPQAKDRLTQILQNGADSFKGVKSSGPELGEPFPGSMKSPSKLLTTPSGKQSLGKALPAFGRSPTGPIRFSVGGNQYPSSRPISVESIKPNDHSAQNVHVDNYTFSDEDEGDLDEFLVGATEDGTRSCDTGFGDNGEGGDLLDNDEEMEDNDSQLAQLNQMGFEQTGLIRLPGHENYNSAIFYTAEFESVTQMVIRVLGRQVTENVELFTAVKSAYWCQALSERTPDHKVNLILMKFVRYLKQANNTNRSMLDCSQQVTGLLGRYKQRGDRAKLPVKRKLPSSAGFPIPSPKQVKVEAKQCGKSSGARKSYYSSLANASVPALVHRGPNGKKYSYNKNGPPAMIDLAHTPSSPRRRTPQKQNGSAGKKDIVQRLTENGYYLSAKLTKEFDKIMALIPEEELADLFDEEKAPSRPTPYSSVLNVGKSLFAKIVCAFITHNSPYFWIENITPGDTCKDMARVMSGIYRLHSGDCNDQMELLYIEYPVLWACMVNVLREVKYLAKSNCPENPNSLYLDVPREILKHWTRMGTQSIERAVLRYKKDMAIRVRHRQNAEAVRQKELEEMEENDVEEERKKLVQDEEEKPGSGENGMGGTPA